jgi:two-component system, NarL family, nitrate/nitrite response regulator NarL
LQLHSPASRTVPFRNQNANRWIPPPRNKPEERAVSATQETARLVRILIVDRDSMSSDLLANALDRDKNYEAIAVDSSELMSTLAMGEVDLVVIASELNVKTRNGFDLAHLVGLEYPNVFIVILLNQSDRDSVINAFRCGARGVFCRARPMTDLLDCVEHVRKGFIWAGRTETDVLLDALRCIPSASLLNESDTPALTMRELQVVQCAAKGRTNRAIAQELGLSEHTVKNYLFRAFDKLGVSSRVELLFYLTMRGHKFTADEIEAPLPKEGPRLAEA